MEEETPCGIARPKSGPARRLAARKLFLALIFRFLLAHQSVCFYRHSPNAKHFIKKKEQKRKSIKEIWVLCSLVRAKSKIPQTPHSRSVGTKSCSCREVKTSCQNIYPDSASNHSEQKKSARSFNREEETLCGRARPKSGPARWPAARKLFLALIFRFLFIKKKEHKRKSTTEIWVLSSLIRAKSINPQTPHSASRKKQKHPCKYDI